MKLVLLMLTARNIVQYSLCHVTIKQQHCITDVVHVLSGIHVDIERGASDNFSVAGGLTFVGQKDVQLFRWAQVYLWT